MNKIKFLLCALIVVAFTVGCDNKINYIDEIEATNPSGNISLSVTEIDLVSTTRDTSLALFCAADWSVTTDQIYWCIPGATSGRGNQELVLTIRANDTGSPRTAKITVSTLTRTATVTVNQP